MSQSSMPNEKVRVEQSGSETLISLPQRDLAGLARFGLIGIGIGGFGILFLAGWIGFSTYFAIAEFNGPNLVAPVVSLLFALFGLPGLWIAVKIFRVGLGLQSNSTWTTISISPNQFFITERIGGVRWTRKFKAFPSHQLVIDDLKNRHGTTPFGSGGDMHCLFAKPPFHEAIRKTARNTTNKPVPIVVGYPRAIIDQLVDALQKSAGSEPLTVSMASDVDSRNSSDSKSSSSDSLTNNANESSAGLPAVPLEQPGGSIIEIEQLDHATVYRLPAVGILKVGFLFWFSILWLTFCCVFFSVFLGVMISDPKGTALPLFIMIPFALLFFAVGIGILIAAINVGRRSSTIGVASGLLWIERISIFGKTVTELETSSIKEICLGPSGTTINDVPVMELHIKPDTGVKIGMMSQFDDDEIEWLIDRLQRDIKT